MATNPAMKASGIVLCAVESASESDSDTDQGPLYSSTPCTDGQSGAGD